MSIKHKTSLVFQFALISMHFARFQYVRLGHKHLEGGSCCWPEELVRFVLLESLSNPKSVTYILVQ